MKIVITVLAFLFCGGTLPNFSFFFSSSSGILVFCNCVESTIALKEKNNFNNEIVDELII